jgi:exodeoxyribonuclease V alpha subunit
MNINNINQCKLIIVGDPNQLRPVARDSIFTTLLEKYPRSTTKLLTNYRSGDAIIDNSLMILNHVSFIFETSDNFQVIEYNLRKDIKFLDWLSDDYQVEINIDDVMYITHRNEDVLYINKCVREELYEHNNISLAELRALGKTQKRLIYKDGQVFGNWEWAIGDRCVCKINLSQYNIYNGSIAKIVGFYKDTITVSYKNKEINISYKSLWPAYAITVHASQGKEWDTVIFCDFSGDVILRSLLYVAITRAKKKLYIKRMRSEESILEPYEFRVIDEEEGAAEWLGDILTYT